VTATAAQQPDRPIVNIFSNEINGFSKYKLAKSYIRWTRSNDSSALSEIEREQWKKLIDAINKALK
jgi:hypothetical protein